MKILLILYIILIHLIFEPLIIIIFLMIMIILIGNVRIHQINKNY